MAFPATTGAGITSGTTTAGTTHTINVGSPTAGMLLIVLIRFTGAQGAVTFTGYTQFATDSSDASDDTTSLYYRQADGAEGASDTLTTGNSIKMAALTWQITDASNPATQAPQTSTVAIGTGANANSTTVTPTGGAKDYLFLAVLGLDGETQTTATQPTNYSVGNLNFATSGTGGVAASNCIVWGDDRQLNAASEDPGAWTIAAPATGWTAWTVAIHPVAVAGFIEAPALIAEQAVMRSNVY